VFQGIEPGTPATTTQRSGARHEAGRRGADGAGSADGEQATSWAPDTGVTAREAWARWATVMAHGAPPVPAIPLPLSKPGRPTVLAVDPPPGSGLTSGSLLQLGVSWVTAPKRRRRLLLTRLRRRRAAGASA
jgi:hypothetical protein